MKKISLTVIISMMMILLSFGQDFKAGIRFSPLNSQYQLDEALGADGDISHNDKTESRNDSLTTGLFFEKYFSKKSFMVRFDVNYSNLIRSETDNSTSSDSNGDDISEFNQTEKQKFWNFNLGIGNQVSYSKFIFSFGVFIPITILPKGTITRNMSYYYNGDLQQKTTCSGTYKPTAGFGVGSFVGINAIILKHLYIGTDFIYQIQYLSRKLDWHGETNYYGNNPNFSYVDEKLKFKNYYTSKIVPSIKIAYAFDLKKKN